jgi:hypothetical protein
MTTVWVYVDTSKEVGDRDHLKVFATPDAADEWFKENDPEGVAIGYEVSGDETRPRSYCPRSGMLASCVINSPSIRTSIVRSMTNEDHNWVRVLRSVSWGSAENSAQQVANICSDYRSQRVRFDDQ